MRDGVGGGEGGHATEDEEFERGKELKDEGPEAGDIAQVANGLDPGEEEPGGADDGEEGSTEDRAGEVVSWSAGKNDGFAFVDRSKHGGLSWVAGG